MTKKLLCEVFLGFELTYFVALELDASWMSCIESWVADTGVKRAAKQEQKCSNQNVIDSALSSLDLCALLLLAKYLVYLSAQLERDKACHSNKC